MTFEPHTSSPTEKLYRYALLLSVAFQVVHAVALPIVVTWDGCLYVDLADVLGSSRFPGDWDSLRTPLFPLGLKLSFWVFGKHPLAVIVLNTVLGFLGVWSLGAAVRRAGFPVAAAMTVLALTFYPILITYQHCLLSDVGVFCALAFLVNVLLWEPRSPALRTSVLIATATVAFYFRPNLLYLAPVVGVLDAVRAISKGRAAREPYWRRASLTVAIVAITPFVLAYPWKRLSADSSSRELGIVRTGFFNQVVIPPEDPSLGPQAEPYREVIQRALVNGSLPMDGIGGGAAQSIAMQTMPQRSEISPLLDIIGRYPLRYTKGVIRTTLLFLGWPAHSSESKLFRKAVFPQGQTQAMHFSEPPWLAEQIREQFAQRTGTSVVSRVSPSLDPLYDLLVVVGGLLTLAGAIAGICRLDWRLLVFSLVPLAFLAMHALALQSVDRYAFPFQAFSVANLVVIPAYLLARWRTTAPASSNTVPDLRSA